MSQHCMNIARAMRAGPFLGRIDYYRRNRQQTCQKIIAALALLLSFRICAGWRSLSLSEPSTSTRNLRPHRFSQSRDQQEKVPSSYPLPQESESPNTPVQQPSTSHSISVTGFIQNDDEIDSCYDNMIAADLNENLQLSSEEYSYFVTLQSNGSIISPFRLLPAEFVMIFYATACQTCFARTANDRCCVGKNAYIDLNITSDNFVGWLMFTCSNVDSAIGGISIEPSAAPITTPSPLTPAPQVRPTARTSHFPTNMPSTTSSASPAPITTPSPLTPAPQVRPTARPSGSPTLAPLRRSSTRPSHFPTEVPSATSSVSPTRLPLTEIPSVLPSPSPSKMITQSPTDFPTFEPSNIPSATPTVLPTIRTQSPTDFPTFKPISIPSTIPTVLPTIRGAPLASRTPEDILCVAFSYGITNDASLSSNDIFNEVNNTLKTGLLIATENVIIQVLNSSFPKNEAPSPNVSEGSSPNSNMGGTFDVPMTNDLYKSNHTNFGDTWKSASSAVQLGLAEEMGVAKAKALTKSYNFVSSEDEHSTQDIDTVNNDRTSDRDRRLVFYTEIIPPEIAAIVDNPLCPQIDDATTTVCSIVASKVCVVLEEGDVPLIVKGALIIGFENAIESGEFEAMIPSEHIPD